MDSGIIIVALAVFTIGITLAAAVFHFAYFLKDPKNLEAARTVANDRESATTKVAGNIGTPRKSLRQRLNESQASNDKVPLFEGLRPHADISGRIG